MPHNLPQLRVDGLTSLQLAELQAAVATAGSDYVTTLGNPSLGGGKAGEPTLLTVIITLGPSVISAIALWLAKQRKGRTRTLRYAKIDPNGAVESFEMDESFYNEGASASATIQTFLQQKLGQ
jgi:hypothetical protein